MGAGRKYEPARETRGWYDVEYLPPAVGNKYAWLNLVITEDRLKDAIANAMEKELELWLTRYPVPIFATAWDDQENIYDLSGIKPKNNLVGFFASDNKLHLYWESVTEEEIPDLTLDQEYLDSRDLRHCRLVILQIDTYVADVRHGEQHTLPTVGRVSKNFLITSHAGVEDQFKYRVGLCAKGLTFDHCSIFQN